MRATEEVLHEAGYESSEEFARDGALLVALSKIEQYRAECEFFERKYNMTLDEFESHIHRQKGNEDFQMEEDFEDWEFSAHALAWWHAKAQELRSAAGV